MSDLQIKIPSEKCSDEKFKYLEKKVKLPWKVMLKDGDCVFYHTVSKCLTTNIENTNVKLPEGGCTDRELKDMKSLVKEPWTAIRKVPGDKCIFYHTKTFQETTNIENTKKKCGNMGCRIRGGRRATRRVRRKGKRTRRRTNKN